MPAFEKATMRFAERLAASAELKRQGRKTVSRSTRRTSFNFDAHAVLVSCGEGAYIDTVNGRRLVDVSNNFTP